MNWLTKLCVLLLVLMTHAIEDLPTNPDVSQTFPIPIETADNGLSDGEQWGNESPGPLSSEKTEEKLITMIKKVPVPIAITKHVPYKIEKIVPIPVRVGIITPVPVERKIPVPIKQIIKVPIHIPQPYPIEKKVPYFIRVPEIQPIPIIMKEFHPYPIERKVSNNSLV
ncbi:zinc finger protein 512B-like [Sitodiplosis mosellana]|uniref:zinc finger protein 512B-like n=1 Tax=Sitodiplosis mosellana TaxID=263140 RepID=UPI0024450AAC|nr:zinc finger protein 512B-like [Sitodiplosis mosellana]